MSKNPVIEQEELFGDSLRAVMPKTILHIDGSTAFDLEEAVPSSHRKRSKHYTRKKPGKGLYIQLTCRFSGEGVFHECRYGRTELQDVVTDQRTKEELIDAEDYFTNGFRLAAEEAIDCRELGPHDDAEPIRLIHLGDHQYKYWEYYLLHKKLKSTTPYVGFVMCDNMPHDKRILTDGKLVSLGEHMESQPVLSQANIFFKDKYHRLDLRACRIKLLDPKYKEAGASSSPVDATIEMTCVLACFVDDPSRKWFLTSNEGSTTATTQDALLIVGMYAKRWHIEVYFLFFRKTFPAQLFLKANYRHYVTETFVSAAMVFRAMQLTHCRDHNPTQKITTLFTATELIRLFWLQHDYKSLESLTGNKLEEMQHALFLRFLENNAKDTAILLAKLDGLDASEKGPEPPFRSLVMGFACVHQLVDIVSQARRQLQEQGITDMDSLPEKITIKIMLP